MDKTKCPNCQKVVGPGTGRRPKVYCSPECRITFNNGKKVPKNVTYATHQAVLKENEALKLAIENIGNGDVALQDQNKTILALQAENKALIAKIDEMGKDGLKTGNKTIVNDLTKPEVKGTAYNPNDNPRWKQKMGLK